MDILNQFYPINTRFDSVIHLVTIDSSKKLRCVGVASPKEIAEKAGSLTVYKSKNYYITANTIKPFCSRRGENLFSLNNIVLDFDIHDQMNHYDRKVLIEDFIWRLKRDLFIEGNPRDTIPAPNIIHSTGRGVQLWWHLEETSAQLLFLYHQIIDYLVAAIQDLLNDCPNLEGIKVDIAASKNPVGLFRLFGFYNTKTGTQTSYEVLHSRAYDLNCLKDTLLQNDAVREYIAKKERRKALQKSRKTSSKANKPKKRRVPNYTELHRKRVWIIQQVIASENNHVGMRNNLLFLAYNSARQLFPSNEAQALCNEINCSFSKPLSKINYIFQDHEPYKMTESIFVERLGISDDDYKKLCAEYFAENRNASRAQRSQLKKEALEKVREAARTLLAAGNKIKDVAAETGLGYHAVAKLSSRMKLQKEKPWESLGLSKSTYYRYKKNGKLEL